MSDFRPGDGNAERLRQYWLHGAGAVKIRWGTPGDWTRCVANLTPYMGARSKGYCTLLHKRATGKWPNPGKGVGGLRGNKTYD